jgi:AcrR family transcriptional regulator
MEKANRDRRDRLIEVAAYLFRTRGYAATSIRDIARAVGIESPTLYHYVRSKEELLFLVGVQSLKELKEKVDPIVHSDLPPVEKLRAFIITHVDTVLNDRDKHTVMLVELKALRPTWRKTVIQLRDQYEDLILSIITEGQNAGVLRRDLPARYLKLALLNLLNWSIFWYRRRGSLTPTEIGQFLAGIFLHGVQATSGPQDLLVASRPTGGEACTGY